MRNPALLVTMLFLIVYQGCAPDKGSVSTKQNSCVVVETPIFLSMAAMSYRCICGKWPNSIRDIDRLLSDCQGRPNDQNLREAEKLVIFEEIPDGRLKITSLDVSLPFTTIVDVPSDGNIPLSDKPPCCN
jgi:hypothetical protein